MTPLLSVAACDVRPIRTSAAATTSAAALATCTQCHGDAAQENAAPPRAVNGATDTADPAVGAHQSHLVAGHFRGPIACQDCHAVPTAVYEPGHIGAVPVMVRFDAPGSSGLASARGATPSIVFAPVDPSAPQRRPDASCRVYCHGATLNGGTRTQPTWAGQYQAGSTTLDCTSCHGVPPPAPHVQNRSCGNCHTGYTATSVVAATHVNGQVDVAPMTCTSCHGDGARSLAAGVDANARAAPPADTAGLTETTAVGAHLTHLLGSAIAAPIACSQCHPVPISTAHSNGVVDMAWGSTATANGGWGPLDNGNNNAALAPSAGAAPAWNPGSASCSATYCHGNYGGTFTFTFFGSPGSAPYAGDASAPVWSGAAVGCNSCHGMPPNGAQWHSGTHGWAGGNDCQTCHPDASGTIVAGAGGTPPTVQNAAITNPAMHVDGRIDLTPNWGDISCSHCHG